MCTVAVEKPFEIGTHNGLVTIKSFRTGEHRTFRIKTQKKDAKFAAGQRVIGVLSGPDNTSDYLNFGFVADGKVHLWKRYADSNFYRWVKECMERPQDFTDKVQFNFEGHCLVCNRLLSDPLSVSIGIGPTCRGDV